MPIYEYHCQSCGHRFDTRRSIINTDKPIACENCGSKETYRTISTFFSRSKGTTTKSSSSSYGSCHGGSCSSCRH